jgi:hypothetical protein
LQFYRGYWIIPHSLGNQVHPAFFLILGLPFLPRSPCWLAKVGRDEETIQTLARIQANGDTTDPLVIAEWEESLQNCRLSEKPAPDGESLSGMACGSAPWLACRFKPGR